MTGPIAERRIRLSRHDPLSPSPTLWGIARHELLFLSFALMEVSLALPIVLVLLGWARYWPASLMTLWLLLLMLLPLNLIRLMGLMQLDLKRQRRTLLVAILLAVLFSWYLLFYASESRSGLGAGQFLSNLARSGNLVWTRDLGVFAVTLFFWWRGMRLAIRQPEINNVGLRLRLGALILLPLIVWLASEYLDVSTVPFILLFFLSSLTAVSLVRAENIEQEHSGTSSRLNARWFAVIFVSAAAVVLAGGLAGVIVTGDSLFTAIAWLSPLWRAMQFAATVAGTTLFELAYPALEVFAGAVQFLAAILARILSLMSAALREANIPQGLATPALPTLTPTPASETPAFTGRAITVFVMLAILVLVVFALARVYRQATFAARESERSRTPESEGGHREGGILQRLGLFGQWRAAASIRRIYRLMCNAAASAGYPRLQMETPYEYLPTLAQVWPDNSAESRLITEAYIQARYGEVPDTQEKLQKIRDAWHVLESSRPSIRETAPEKQLTLEDRP